MNIPHENNPLRTTGAFMPKFTDFKRTNADTPELHVTVPADRAGAFWKDPQPWVDEEGWRHSKCAFPDHTGCTYAPREAP